MAVKTLKNYMFSVAQDVRAKLASKIGEKFALVLDGWSCDSRHFVAVFSSLPSEEDSSGLVGLQPFGR